MGSGASILEEMTHVASLKFKGGSAPNPAGGAYNNPQTS